MLASIRALSFENMLKLKLAVEEQKRSDAEASHQLTKEKLKDVVPWPVQSEPILYNNFPLLISPCCPSAIGSHMLASIRAASFEDVLWQLLLA